MQRHEQPQSGVALVLRPRREALVRRIAGCFRSDDRGERAVYLVLLSPMGGECGIYVGETGISSPRLLREYLAGPKAPSHVRRRGLSLLDVTTHLTRMSAIEAKRVSGDLADSLRDQGFEVTLG